jgi:hypothetical protein
MFSFISFQSSLEAWKSVLSPINLDIPLKSELTNIDILHFAGMQDQLPGCVKAHLGKLGLPEFQTEGAVQVFDAASAFDEIDSHSWS